MSFSVLKIFAVFVIFGRFGCGIQFNCYDCRIGERGNDCNDFDDNTRIKKCSQCWSLYSKETDPNTGQTLNGEDHGCADSLQDLTLPGCNK